MYFLWLEKNILYLCFLFILFVFMYGYLEAIEKGANDTKKASLTCTLVIYLSCVDVFTEFILLSRQNCF